MPRLSWTMVLAIALVVPGCLDASGDDAPTRGLGPAGPGAGEQAGVRFEQELGSIAGTTVQPANYTFQVAVPEGGATEVYWRLRYEGPYNLGSTVEGPGCEPSGNLVAGPSATTYGADCDDLPAGVHTFVARINGPGISFRASVTGSVPA